MDEVFRHEPANKARKLTGNDNIINVGGVNVEASNYGFTVDGYTVYAQRTPLGISFVCAKKGDDVITIGDIVGKELAPYSKLYLITSSPNKRTQPEGLHLRVEIDGASLKEVRKIADPRQFTVKLLKTTFDVEMLKQGILDIVKGEFDQEVIDCRSRLHKKTEQVEKISSITGIRLPDNWPL